MPIKGLTDRRAPTFPKIGDIRKGAKKTQDDRPGKDLTFFRYAPLEGEEEAAAAFAAVYGNEPREINILLPFDEIERNFDAFMERHTAGALQCRGDGETAFMWRDDDGKMQHTPKPCPSDGCEGCKETGRLKVIIPELRRLAFVTVHTTSIWDIQELTNNLRALKSMTGNGLRGIPLVLKRRPRTVSTPRANGKRVRQEKWLLSIEADQSWVEHQLTALKIQALPASVEAPEMVDDVDVDIMTGEIMDDDDLPFADPADEPQEEQGPGEGDVKAESNGRPYTPAQVRHGIRSKAQWLKGNADDWSDAKPQPDNEQEPPDEQTVKRVAAMIGDAFPDNNDNARHSVLLYLVNKDSTKLLTEAEVAACSKWLEAGPGAWKPSGVAAEECRLILRETLVDQGQQEMALNGG